MRKESGSKDGHHNSQPQPARVEDLSSRRQEIIRPVLENPREFVLLSVRSMAERLHTDPATIVRIVQGMGFDGFKAFKQHLHDLSLANVTSFDLMQSAIAKESNVAAQARGSLDQDLKNLNALRHTLEPERIGAVGRRLVAAKRILIIGGDHAACLVSYLEYQMTLLGLPVLSATTTGRTIHVTRTLTSKDVAIGLSFGRGLRLTVEGMQQARENGAYCIGVTDTYVSPLTRYADEFFLAAVESPSFGPSYAAPIALLNMFLLCCAASQRDRSLEFLRKADEEQRSGYRWYSE
jgi:RpiR family carbohydrate utilization transcriptional regulator